MNAAATTATRPPPPATFASLSNRNYRLFFAGQLISVTGTWTQTVAQSFLVLQLTGSGAQLGFATAARFTPLFLFAAWGGVAADRFNKRRVLCITQIAAGALACAFGTLVSTGAIRMWMVYVLAVMLGFVNVFDNPARQAFISELVPKELLRNAVALFSVTQNMARIFGGLIAGLLVTTLGIGLCFQINALSFGAVLITLLLMNTAQIRPSPPEPRERGQIRAGLRYVRSDRALLLPLIMIAIVGALAWEFQISIPLIAQQTFHGGPATYGLMASVMGVGAVIGGLIVASRHASRLRALAVSAVGWGIAITLAALAPTLVFEYVLLLFVGYGSIAFNSMAKTSLQLASVPEMRGRLMALWALAWQGSTPIGGPIVGWVGEQFGARAGLLVGGLPTIAVGVVAYPLLSRLDRGPQEDDATLEPSTADDPDA